MAHMDQVVSAVKAELARRKMSRAGLAALVLERRPGLWAGPEAGKAEITYWLTGKRNLRSDKVSAVLAALGLRVGRGVRRGRRGGAEDAEKRKR